MDKNLYKPKLGDFAVFAMAGGYPHFEKFIICSITGIKIEGYVVAVYNKDSVEIDCFIDYWSYREAFKIESIEMAKLLYE